jgi:outer membrane lipoprotein carrier protein
MDGIKAAFAAILLTACAAECLALTTDNSPAAAAELERYLAGIKSFEADFVQTLRDSRGQQRDEARGRLYLEKPGRFRWEYREPSEQLIVSDGRNVWLHDVELEQVTVKPFDASLSLTPASLLAGQASVQDSFSIQAGSSVNGVKWFDLVPKRQDTDFVRVRLGFKRGELAGMELEDKLQQRTAIEFSAVKRNPRLQRKLFAFAPPAGVDVIGKPVP